MGLGEMFEGDFAETCTGKFCAYVNGGPSRRSSVLCIVSSARYARVAGVKRDRVG